VQPGSGYLAGSTILFRPITDGCCGLALLIVNIDTITVLLTPSHHFTLTIVALSLSLDYRDPYYYYLDPYHQVG
jgi:hypothetical protein